MTVGMDSYDGPEEMEEGSQDTHFPHPGAWVQEWLLPHFRRNPKVFRWHPQWWRFEEAGTVVEAMWRSWEQTRIDPDPRVMATWMRDVFYPLMQQLTGPEGPFWDHHEALGKHDVPAVFVSDPAPESLFELPAED